MPSDVVVADDGRNVVHTLGLGDALEVARERPSALFLDPLQIHGGGVEIPDLLPVAPLLGILVGRGLLQNLLEQHEVALPHLVRDAPDAVLIRDRVVLQPLAVGVLVEILTGVDRGVHVPTIEPTLVGKACRTHRHGPHTLHQQDNKNSNCSNTHDKSSSFSRLKTNSHPPTTRQACPPRQVTVTLPRYG